MQVKFLRGLQAQLPTSGHEGSFYLTTDTDRLYVGKQDGTLALLNQSINIVTNTTDLPKAGAASLNDFYYVTNGNIFAFYNGSDWVQINPDKFYTLVESAAALTTSVTNGVATVGFSIADTAGKAVSGNFKIKSGSDNVSITKDGDAISIAVAAPDTVDFSIATKQENADNTATIVLNKQIGSQAAAEDSSITLKGNSFVTVDSDANGVTIAAVDQTVTSVGNAFNDKGEFRTVIAQNGKEVASAAITPIVKIGSNDEEIKFLNGEADLAVYTMTEIDNKLALLETKANAMSYRGTIAKYEELASKTPENGDVYMLSDADGNYEQGDLFIYNDVTKVWDYVPAGNDLDTTYTFTAIGNGANRLTVSSLGSEVGSIAVVSGQKINAVGQALDANNLKVTIDHAEITTTQADGTDQTQAAQGELTFDVVDAVEADGYGHVTKVTTKSVKVVDTHNKLSEVAVSAAATNNVATVTTAVSMLDGESDAAAVKLSSETLAVTAPSADTVKVELVWETFA